MQSELVDPILSARPAQGRGSVLVVDDQEQNRTLLRDRLEAQGYEVSEAADGDEALLMIAGHAPDVILLDLMMPGMDGFEVCRHLKQAPATAHIPILMVTALSEREERLKGVAAGANDFLLKPVDIQDLILRVGNAVYTKELFDQLQAERRRADQLLLNILPGPIAERMKAGEATIADLHPDVTVMVADLAGFAKLSAHIGPDRVVCLLNEVFSVFDLLVEQNGLDKIKTIGDAYMVAGGLISPLPDHAKAMVDLALSFQRSLQEINSQYNTSIRLRIGMCTGPVVAGVIGRKRFAYDLWGETVNMACRLGSLAAPGGILVADSTFRCVHRDYRFDCLDTGPASKQGSAPAYTLAQGAAADLSVPPPGLR